MNDSAPFSFEDERFNGYITEALHQSFEGWDFGFLDWRMTSSELPWHYVDLAKQKTRSVQSMLDMGTGGGELLASLAPFPKRAFATEGYLPNISVAARRLHPLQVQVVAVDGEEKDLPFQAGAFELVLNRHESFWAPELFRILGRGGCFLTQQVGGRDNLPLNMFLQDRFDYPYSGWCCDAAVHDLEIAGFKILRKEESYPEVLFRDIGAVVFYLRVISWQIPDFSVERYRQRLFDLHLQIQKDGGFRSHSHRFLIEARKTN